MLPSSRWDSLLFQEINQATDFSNLKELRKTNVKEGDIEIRVWRGFGLSPLEGVVFNRTDGEWSGLHIKIKKDRNYEIEGVEIKRLYPPKSGWESFWKELSDKGIVTVQQSLENECDISGFDGVVYVVEINQHMTYRNYSYPEGNGEKCRGAKQTEEIGEIIGLEFDSGQEECKTSEWFACMPLRKSLDQTSQ